MISLDERWAQDLYNHYYSEIAVIAKSKNTERSKICRNEKCPCGSGLKYKKCCMRRKGIKEYINP